jgi:uncharacterized membrane protein YoaK (UPF0700 family)
MLDPNQSLLALKGCQSPNMLVPNNISKKSLLDIGVSPSLRREETVLVALLLALAGGYLDAFTWIIHGVMANAQTANLVFLWVYGSAGNWAKALHFVPPMIAFAVGIVVAAWLGRAAGERAGYISILTEILLLLAVGVVHNHLPDLAGTLGISFVAALQTAIFTRVEGVAYSSVMATGNFRQAIEGLFGALYGPNQIGALRRSGIFTGLCVAFGAGAAVGAFLTKQIPYLALGIPIVVLLVVLLLSETQRGWIRK